MKLKEFMEKERYTATLISRATGISRPSISNYLKGKEVFGRKRAQILVDFSKGKISLYEIMFPDLDLKEVNKKNNKKQQQEKQENDQNC